MQKFKDIVQKQKNNKKNNDSPDYKLLENDPKNNTILSSINVNINKISSVINVISETTSHIKKMSVNIGKLISILKPEYFQKSLTKEKEYEQKFIKYKGTGELEKKSDRSSIAKNVGVGGLVLGAVGGLAAYFLNDDFKRSINNMIDSFGKSMFGEENWGKIKNRLDKEKKDLSEKIKENIGILALFGAGIVALLSPINSLFLAIGALKLALLGGKGLISGIGLAANLLGKNGPLAIAIGAIYAMYKATDYFKEHDTGVEGLPSPETLPSDSPEAKEKQRKFKEESGNVPDFDPSGLPTLFKSIPDFQIPSIVPEYSPEEKKDSPEGNNKTSYSPKKMSLKEYESEFGTTYASNDPIPYPKKEQKTNNKIDYSRDVLINKGWSREQAAGIIGNLLEESDLNPAALNKKENAQGIAQWRGDRIKKFEELYKIPLLNSSLDQQLEYLNWELNNTEKFAGNALRKTKTVEEATKSFDRFYERSALGAKGITSTSRISNAIGAYKGESLETQSALGVTKSGTPILSKANQIQIPNVDRQNIELSKTDSQSTQHPSGLLSMILQPAIQAGLIKTSSVAGIESKINKEISSLDIMKKTQEMILNRGSVDLSNAQRDQMRQQVKNVTNINQNTNVSGQGQSAPIPNPLDMDISKLVANLA